MTAVPMAVVPATAERWADVQLLLGDDGDRGCRCQYWRQSSGDYSRLGPGGGRRALRGQLDEAIPPGLVAYIGGEPAGWCGFGPRILMRLDLDE